MQPEPRTPNPHPRPLTVLFAGGGTGGHLYPNLAVLQRLREAVPEPDRLRAIFLVSERAVDRAILETHHLERAVLPAVPLAVRPDRLARFAYRLWRSGRQVERLIDKEREAGRDVRMLATGGFVSAPALAAARRRGVTAGMVNLDAVPGRANRLMAPRASRRFSTYATGALGECERIGFPLRRELLPPHLAPPPVARRRLGLDPDRPTLLVTAGSQGGVTVNRTLIALLQDAAFREALGGGGRGWQVLHLSGRSGKEELRTAYAGAGVKAEVRAFCDDMPAAWSAADLAISRAGAGSVAEVGATATPTVFLPYPFHKDEHQRLNAQPLADTGGAILATDHVDSNATAAAVGPVLLRLLNDPAERATMREALHASQPGDGADRLAQWLLEGT